MRASVRKDWIYNILSVVEFILLLCCRFGHCSLCFFDVTHAKLKAFSPHKSELSQKKNTRANTTQHNKRKVVVLKKKKKNGRRCTHKR